MYACFEKQTNSPLTMPIAVFWIKRLAAINILLYLKNILESTYLPKTLQNIFHGLIISLNPDNNAYEIDY